MVDVPVTKLWLNLASDTSQAWDFEFFGKIQSTPQVQSTQEIDATGDINTISTPGITKQYAGTLLACDAARRQAIEFDLLDEPLWLRDNLGRKFGASYSSCQTTEHLYNDECDIDVTFLLESLSEEV